MYKWISAFVALNSFFVKAQKLANYKTIDSLSYTLYINAKWQELSKLKVSNKINYHYLNLRKGIAFYQLKKYHRAEKYLLKAYEQNKGSNITTQYLYSASTYTKNLFICSELHPSVVGDSVRYSKIISSINIDAGIKLAQSNVHVGNINFFSLGLSHLPSKKIVLYQSYTFQNQENNSWGNYTQQQYYIGSSLKLNNKWSVDLGSHLHQYKANINFNYDTSYVKITLPKFPGDYKTDSIYTINHLLKGEYLQHGMFFYLGFSRVSGPIKISPFVEYNLELPNSNLTETQLTTIEISKTRRNSSVFNTTLNKDTTIKYVDYLSNVKQIIFGAQLQYTVPFNKEKITLGLNIYQPIKSKSKTIFSPYAKVKLGNNLLYISYLKKNGISIAEFYGSILVNSYDNIHHRVNAQLNLPLSKKTSLSLLYQWENKTDFLSLVRFNSNMFSLSLFLKL